MNTDGKKDSPRSEPLIHSLDEKPREKSTRMESRGAVTGKKVALIFFVVIVLGVASGFGGAMAVPGKGGGTTTDSSDAKNANDSTDSSNTAGVDDPKLFKDSAEGLLKEGGVEGEGEYHLERPGGESQNVYLTSTTVDLSKYVGSEVKVKGQTFSAQVAGWLMEVGYLEVIE